MAKIDFGKLARDAAGSVSTLVHPRDLFSALPAKASGYDYLRGPQDQVLAQWHDRRATRDLVIKMNTGGGKTIVGLLMPTRAWQLSGERSSGASPFDLFPRASKSRRLYAALSPSRVPGFDADLTRHMTAAGCAAKANNDLRLDVRADLPIVDNISVVVGFDDRDDAAVVDIGNGWGPIATVDVILPPLADPFYRGWIAAANAASDVYAMKGLPHHALSIFGIPRDLTVQTGRRIMQVTAICLQRQGVVLLDGHTVHGETPLFGILIIFLTIYDAWGLRKKALHRWARLTNACTLEETSRRKNHPRSRGTKTAPGRFTRFGGTHSGAPRPVRSRTSIDGPTVSVRTSLKRKQP